MQKAKPKLRKPKQNVSDNLLIAIGITATISILCSAATAYLIQKTLNAFQSSHAMAGLITASGVVFDDKNTEAQLSSATLALMATRDISMAVGFGSIMVVGGLAYRAFKLR